jgi:hypothetical protein
MIAKPESLGSIFLSSLDLMLGFEHVLVGDIQQFGDATNHVLLMCIKIIIRV